MKSSPFQIIVIAAFSFFIVAGMVALYFTKARGSSSETVSLTIWGTVPSVNVMAVVEAVKAEKNGLSVSYVQFPPESFDQSLVEALASFRGPDAVIISQDSIIRLQDKISIIPYETFSQRAFIDTFAPGAELFMSPWGIMGVPFGIDPLVTYWNRDMFASAGIAMPPQHWDDFLRLSEILTKKDSSGKIIQSAVAMGEFSNINNAKAIISAMAMQAGSQFVVRKSDGSLQNVIDQRALVSVLDFYTEFANPRKRVHSWSRGMPRSFDAFARGDAGVYFGFSSEIPYIRARNPNLDFDVTYFPTAREGKSNATFGQVYAVSVLRSSRNQPHAMKLALMFGSAQGVSSWSATLMTPPVRRDLLSQKGKGINDPIFYNSALRARAWLDPDARRTTVLFRDMVENVTSGWHLSGQAVNQFSSQMSNLILGR
jgi:ABC-type glycerol-3-phosphate transport system substrate-binding protein